MHNSLTSVSWDISLPCNYRCIYCRNDWSDIKNQKFPTMESIQEGLKNIVAAGCTKVIFTGGEFFLLPQWRQVLLETHKFHLEAWIITNTSLIDTDEVDFIVKHCSRLNISFHAASKSLYTKIMCPSNNNDFSKAITNLQALSKAGANLNLFFTPLPENHGEFYNTVRMLINEKINLQGANVNRIIPNGNPFFKENYTLSIWNHATIIRQALAIGNKFSIPVTLEGYPSCFLKVVTPEWQKIADPCLLGRRVIAMANNGQLKLCPCSGRKEKIHISEQGRIGEFLEIFQIQREKIKPCMNCEYWDECLGGCHVCGGLNAKSRDPLAIEKKNINLEPGISKDFFMCLWKSCEPFLSKSYLKEKIQYTIILNGRSVGVIACKQQGPFLEIALLPEERGKGTAFWALQLFLTKHPKKRYGWTADKRNHPSLRLLQKMGGGLVGTIQSNQRRKEAEGFFYPMSTVNAQGRENLAAIIHDSKELYQIWKKEHEGILC